MSRTVRALKDPNPDSSDAGGLWASMLEHAVQGMNGDSDFGGAAGFRTRRSASPITRLKRLTDASALLHG